MKERLTTYHCGKAVIKDKNKLSEAMEKLAKLEDREESGEWVDAVELAKIAIALESQKWIPVSERLPKDESYILVSFENSTMPDIARYEENDEGGAFYSGDDEKSYSSYGFFVNAWMPLPEPYKGE